jgi:ribonuclease BN (tRNA processing enzyme)
MVDCGLKTPQALFELGLAPRSIENFFITHTHADHTGGLEEIALTARYGTKKKPRIYIPEYFEDILWNFTLRGGCAYNERNRGRPLEFADFWDVRRPRWLPGYSRETWEFDVGSINLKAFRTKHIPDSAVSWEDSFPSFGLLVDDRVLFTGDTRYDPDLVRDYGSRAKIEAVFHDCQLFPGGVHASLEEISRLPAKIKARTRLMHYQDTWEKSIDAAAAAGFAGFAEQNAFYVFP